MYAWEEVREEVVYRNALASKRALICNYESCVLKIMNHHLHRLLILFSHNWFLIGFAKGFGLC